MKNDDRKISLYQRKSGTWYARIWDEDAKQFSPAKSTGTTDRAEAERKARDMEKAGAFRRRDADPLFLDALRAYWERRKPSITLNYYKETIGYIEKRIAPFPTLRRKKLRDVKAAHIYQLVDHLQDNKATPATISRIIQLLKVFFLWAYRRDYIDVDIARKIERPKIKTQARGALTPEEIAKLAALPWPDHRAKVAVLLAMFASMRRGEVQALRWKDINFDDNTIDINRAFTNNFDDKGKPIFKDPKAGSARRWPYLGFDELKKALIQLRAETPYNKPEDLVLINIWDGDAVNEYRPINEATLRWQLRDMLTAIGISRDEQKRRKLVFHSLRHTFVSLLSMFASARTVMPLGGHRQISTWLGYTHNMDEAAVAAIYSANKALDEHRRPGNIDQTIQ